MSSGKIIDYRFRIWHNQFETDFFRTSRSKCQQFSFVSTWLTRPEMVTFDELTWTHLRVWISVFVLRIVAGRIRIIQYQVNSLLVSLIKHLSEKVYSSYMVRFNYPPDYPFVNKWDHNCFAKICMNFQNSLSCLNKTALIKKQHRCWSLFIFNNISIFYE